MGTPRRVPAAPFGGGVVQGQREDPGPAEGTDELQQHIDHLSTVVGALRDSEDGEHELEEVVHVTQQLRTYLKDLESLGKPQGATPSACS